MTTDTAPVAESLRALPADWFEDVLRGGGFPGVVVTGAALEPMAFTGAVADMARVRFAYDPSGPAGPPSAIAKIRGTQEFQVGMDAAMGLFDREARFYTELAPQLPVGAPRCYHAGDGTATPLLLEDLDDHRMGDQVHGLSVEDGAHAMDALAAFHAASWEGPATALDWLASPTDPVFAGMIAQLVGSGAGALEERFAGRAPTGALAAVAGLAPRWTDVLVACARGPATVVHNDCRLDNMFFASDGAPVFVDWQVVARTRGTQDVANLLAGSMDIEHLRGHWEALVGRYHAGLVAHGVEDYRLGECIEHYRQSILYPLGQALALLGTLGATIGRGLGDIALLRTLLHCHDLDAFATV